MPVTQVSNMDIAGLCDRTTLFARELIASQSAFNGGFFLDQDRARLTSYLDRLESFASAANSQPLDLPRIHNIGHALLKQFPTDDQIEAVENQDVKDILRRFKALWIDMSESQSADIASGINRFDLARFRAVIGSSRNLLAMATESMDLPENQGNVPVPVPNTGTRASGGSY